MADKFTDPGQAVAYKGPDEIVHFTDFLLDKTAARNSYNFKGGFELFDKTIGGLETGEVIVVTGNTKNGKTLFAESWINSMASKDPDCKAIVFSFEIQTEKLLVKYMGNERLPIYVPKSLRSMDFDWLLNRCMEAKYKYNCRVVLIDHLHFMVDMNTKLNMSLNIGAFMRRLKKDIALDLGMAVILIAHQGQPKEDKGASMGGIRDSSFVGQESDSTIIVSRRKNLDDADLKEIESKFGLAYAESLRPPIEAAYEDNYSAGLATVTVAVNRRTGVFDWKKLFQKRGHFLEEV